jgi:hypothetical protein
MVVSELLLRCDEGRRMFDLIPLAFLRPDVHQSSRSTYEEFRELEDVLIEAAVLDRSLALRSLRSPTFSVSGPVQDRSAVNMFFRP